MPLLPLLDMAWDL